MHVHGGGPPLCREELDMYSATCNPETDLFLSELHGKASADFARRTSRQFVDDCQGDGEMYDQRYGQGRSSDTAAAVAVSNAGTEIPQGLPGSNSGAEPASTQSELDAP